MDITGIASQATVVVAGLGTFITTNAGVIGLIGIFYLSLWLAKLFVKAIMYANELPGMYEATDSFGEVIGGGNLTRFSRWKMKRQGYNLERIR